MNGSFVRSLVLTDVASGWRDCVALLVREARLVVEALGQIWKALPFQLREIVTHNGTEFLNETLVGYCCGQGIELRQSRPYRKNDQVWAEQKNGVMVTRLVRCDRLDSNRPTRTVSQTAPHIQRSYLSQIKPFASSAT